MTDHNIPGSLIAAILEDLMERVRKLERLHSHGSGKVATFEPSIGSSRRVITAAEQEKMMDLHSQGWSAIKIGELMDCSHQTVLNQMKKRGLEFINCGNTKTPGKENHGKTNI